jgi:predicted nucleic acid-binding protein
MPPKALYLDTSAVLRAVLEGGTSPELEARIGAARVLVTSRLSLVETCRALLRLRATGRASEAEFAEARRGADAVWARCELWEISASVCEAACAVAPDRGFRALDAIHLATFVIARGHLPGLELLTADERLREAGAGL